MSDFLLIRHGPTLWNDQRRLQGRTDEPLSDTSRNALARLRLPDGWDSADVLASPLQRCLETARLLTGRSPRIIPALIEQHWGDWEGRTLTEISHTTEADGLEGRPPGGESLSDVLARLAPCIATLPPTAVLVAHRGILQALLVLATGWDNRGKPPLKPRPFTAHHFRREADRLHLIAGNLPLPPR